jgi:hypothetical protein
MISVSQRIQKQESKCCLSFFLSGKQASLAVSSNCFNDIFHVNHYADIKPFILYKMPEEYAHLCAVRAYSNWVFFSHVTEGYLFRKIRANDRIAEENEPMV